MSEIDTEQFKKIVKAIRIAEVAGINVTLTPEECAYLYSVFDNLNAEIGQMEADLTRRDEIIRRLKEDGERLVKIANYERPHSEAVTLHRQLMAEIEEEK